MRNPEDTKFVWDEKNFNTVKETLCSKSYTEEVLKLLVDACIEYEIIDVKATEGSDIKTINEYEFSIGEDHFVLTVLYYHSGKITFSGFVSYSNDDFFTSLGIQDFITKMKDSLKLSAINLYTHILNPLHMIIGDADHVGDALDNVDEMVEFLIQKNPFIQHDLIEFIKSKNAQYNS